MKPRAVIRCLAPVLAATALLGCEGEESRGRPDSSPAMKEPAGTPYELRLPLGLDEERLAIPADNPLTVEKVALGKMLYFDPRLSRDGTVSCATCHSPRFGFTDGRPVSTGIGAQKGGRSAPTVVNRAFSEAQFWDGRAPTLEEQAKGPMANPIEMGFTHEEAVERLRAIPGYRERFREAFGTEAFTIEEVAKAIASYERTVLSGNSPFDRYQAGDRGALSEAAARGLALFEGKAGCARCHLGPNFTDESYHNLGVGMDREEPDLGRFAVTGREEDRGAFKTPTLRDVALTAPYFHEGSAGTLEEVVDYYDRGGTPNPHLSPKMKPLALTREEKRDLAAFLRALTGETPMEALAPELPPEPAPATGGGSR